MTLHYCSPHTTGLISSTSSSGLSRASTPLASTPPPERPATHTSSLVSVLRLRAGEASTPVRGRAAARERESETPGPGGRGARRAGTPGRGPAQRPLSLVVVCVDSRTSCASDEGVGARKHECKQNHTRARLARGQRTCRARAHTRHPTTETLRRAGTHITLIHALSSPR